MLTPEVACYDGVDTYAFSYSYTGDTPIVIPIGDDNAVTGGEEGDNPLQPTIFAPGEHVTAFWKMTGDDPITWSLTGPDGVPRRVTAGSFVPECEFGPNQLDGTQLIVTPGTPVLGADGTTASLEIEITGLPELSTCPAGLEPAPMTLYTGGDPIDASPTTLTVTLRDVNGHQVADFRPNVWGLNHCTYQGQETVSWSDQVYTDLPIIYCFTVADGALVQSDAAGVDCPYIAPTGGGRIRPTDSTTTAAT